MVLIVITVLSIVLSIMPTLYASHQIQLQPSHDKDQNLQLYIPTLPRKLMAIDELTLKVKGTEFVSFNRPNGALPDKPHHKEREVTHAKRGTYQEFVERPADMSQFFSMDYTHVRRRRPIHNKFVPVGP